MGPAGTAEGGTAGHNEGTRTGTKQQRPPGAADPDSSENTQRTTALDQVPGNTNRRRDGHVRNRQQNEPPVGYRTAAVSMDEYAPSSVPSPCRL